MPITKLYHTWMNKITQLLPNERVTRVRNLAWLLSGIFQSKSVHLSKGASKIPGTAMLVSITRRLALLNYIHKLLPADASVLVLGDSKFGAVEVLKQLDQWSWKYVLRQKGSHLMRENDQSPWIALGSLLTKAGQSLWLGQRQLTQLHAYAVNVLAHWKIGEKEPWLLATNLPSLREALKAYERRRWIEEMFGDLKDNGFDLESTHLRSVFKLHRLTFTVVLLFLEWVTSGSKIIKNGMRRLVDRPDRRDLSVFRIGLYMRERHLANSNNLVLDSYPVL